MATAPTTTLPAKAALPAAAPSTTAAAGGSQTPPVKQAAALRPLEEETLEALKLNGAVMEKAAAEYQKQAEIVRQTELLIPSVVEMMTKAGECQPEEIERAKQTLRQPTQVLELLKYACEKLFELRKAAGTALPATEVNGNGEAGHRKSAGAAFSGDAVAARRRQFEEERDRQYDRDIGRN